MIDVRSKPKTYKKKQFVPKFGTDKFAIGLHHCMLSDFRTLCGSSFRRADSHAIQRGINSFRELESPVYSTTSVWRFKCHAQADALLKKYRFANDFYSDDELAALTMKKFFEDQRVICSQPVRTERAFRVLQEARKIASRILGSYDSDEIIEFAKFGTKSSIGCPLSFAYIDYKLSNVRAFTSSRSVLSWFKKDILSSDTILSRIIKRLPEKGGDSDELRTESLTLKTVPKSWKVLRVITPLTLLGLFYSFGVGGVVTERLRKVGLDIRFLQRRHRMLVEKFSKTRTHTTADLSRASDSITSELCNQVLPRAWYVAIKKMTTHQLVYEDQSGSRSAYTGSILPMGNGATFPLETLIFYCVIKAIGNLSRVHGIFSVYGDDLIYPSRIHKYVKVLFPELGFKLNLEKTFSHSEFRESCGADFYRGADVRPFFLKGEHQELTRTKYAAYLYKVYNGLIQRWHPSEIRQTLFFILKELALTGLPILRVPPSFPATAGLHTATPDEVPLDLDLLNFRNIRSIFRDGSRWFDFFYLQERSPDRFVICHEPYYWLALQGRTDSDPFLTTNTPELRWKKFIRYRSYITKKKRKKVKVLTRWKAVVSEKNSQKRCFELSASSVSDWT